jgi:hypothetical protein
MGSLFVVLSGNTKYKIYLSVDQHKNNINLLNDFKSILDINSNLVSNKRTNVLKLSKSGDKYLKKKIF